MSQPQKICNINPDQKLRWSEIEGIIYRPELHNLLTIKKTAKKVTKN